MAIITDNYLKELIGIKTNTLNLYLCRAEFIHIEKTNEGKITYYKGITRQDITRLQKLAQRKNNRWKTKNEQKN